MSDLDEALEILRWGAGQREFSASLTPAQCRALLAEVEALSNERFRLAATVAEQSVEIERAPRRRPRS